MKLHLNVYALKRHRKGNVFMSLSRPNLLEDHRRREKDGMKLLHLNTAKHSFKLNMHKKDREAVYDALRSNIM